MLLNDYESSYQEILEKIGITTLRIRRIKLLAIEIFKTLNDINPYYMKVIFELNTRRDTDNKRLIAQTQNLEIWLIYIKEFRPKNME